MKHKLFWTALVIFAGIGVCLLSGCASFETHATKERYKAINELVDCQLKAAESKDLTCRQVFDLQAGCHDLYKMKGWKTK